MATHTNHTEKECFYFVTFTCYKWLPLIEETKLYDFFSKSFEALNKRNLDLCGYVIMPNHVHLLLYTHVDSHDFNTSISEMKRFMSYEIIKRLKKDSKQDLLTILADGVQENERKKGKKHQVFRLSFDAKRITGEEEIIEVLDYIHHNPVSGKWSLVDDFTDYNYSSAGFYELEKEGFVSIKDYRKLFSESSKE